MHVIVLGSGVIGTTTAYYLARQGAKVTVLDRQPGAAQETSYANAGQVSPGYSTPWAAPGIPVSYTHLDVYKRQRLSRMLHVLLHMAEQDAPLTSETIGKMLNTNPVVVRRMMSGLRERGYVQSEKGHGGGWVLTRPLSELTLLDVYQALGEPPIFALGLDQSCLLYTSRCV